MVSRDDVNRWLKWCGMGVGAAGIVLYILGACIVIHYGSLQQTTHLGGGALIVDVPGWPSGWSATGGTLQCFFIPHWREQPSNGYHYVFPFWPLVLVGLVSLYLHLPKTSVKPGCCAACGFDLRDAPPDAGSPGRVRCPECGRTTARTHPAPPPN